MSDPGHTPHDSSSRPRAGELRVARLGDLTPRLVLVLRPADDAALCAVALVTNEIDLATDADVRIDAGETGLEYPVLVESDLVAPVWDAQLDEPIARLPAAVKRLTGLIANGVDGIDEARLGIPLTGRDDPRRQWKRAELRDLHALASHCISEAIDSPEVTAPSLAELAAVRLPAPEPVAVDVAPDVAPPEWEFREAIGAQPALLAARIPIARGVEATVDLLSPAQAPLVAWDAADPAAKAVAERLVHALWPDAPATPVVPWTHELRDGRAARALRLLAFAEMRMAEHPLSAWAVDGALAASELVDAMGLEDDGAAEEGLVPLLALRLPEAVDVVCGLPDRVLDQTMTDERRASPELRENLLRDLEAASLWRQLDRLPGLAAELRDWIARQRADRGFLDRMSVPGSVHATTPGHLGGERPSRWPVSLGVLASGLVDRGTELEVTPDGQGSATATLDLRRDVAEAFSDVLRAWEGASQGGDSDAQRELKRAAGYLDVISRAGSPESYAEMGTADRLSFTASARLLAERPDAAPAPELPALWVQQFSKRTGELLSIARLQGTSRLEATIPAPAADTSVHVTLRPGELAGAFRSLLESLVFVPLEPAAAAGQLLFSAQHDVARDDDRRRALIAAGVATLRVATVLDQGDTALADLAEAFKKLDPESASAFLPAEAYLSVAARLLRLARDARSAVASTASHGLSSREVARLEPGDQGIRIEGALEHLEELVRLDRFLP